MYTNQTVIHARLLKTRSNPELEALSLQLDEEIRACDKHRRLAESIDFGRWTLNVDGKKREKEVRVLVSESSYDYRTINSKDTIISLIFGRKIEHEMFWFEGKISKYHVLPIMFIIGVVSLILGWWGGPKDYIKETGDQLKSLSYGAILMIPLPLFRIGFMNRFLIVKICKNFETWYLSLQLSFLFVMYIVYLEGPRRVGVFTILLFGLYVVFMDAAHKKSNGRSRILTMVSAVILFSAVAVLTQLNALAPTKIYSESCYTDMLPHSNFTNITNTTVNMQSSRTGLVLGYLNDGRFIFRDCNDPNTSSRLRDRVLGIYLQDQTFRTLGVIIAFFAKNLYRAIVHPKAFVVLSGYVFSKKVTINYLHRNRRLSTTKNIGTPLLDMKVELQGNKLIKQLTEHRIDDGKAAVYATYKAKTNNFEKGNTATMAMKKRESRNIFRIKSQNRSSKRVKSKVHP